MDFCHFTDEEAGSGKNFRQELPIRWQRTVSAMYCPCGYATTGQKFPAGRRPAENNGPDIATHWVAITIQGFAGRHIQSTGILSRICVKFKKDLVEAPDGIWYADPDQEIMQHQRSFLSP